VAVSITVDGVAYDVPSSAADTNWAAEQVAFEQALATAVNEALTAVAAPSWTAIVTGDLTNGWTVGAVGRRSISPAGFVTLQLSIIGGSTSAVAYTLPSGWRPPVAFNVPCMTINGTPLSCTARISANGTVEVFDDGASDPSSDGVDIYVTFPNA
jgi:hypothetical protein